MKTLADFALLDNWKKIVTLEAKPGRPLEEEIWTQHGTYTDTYYLDFIDGEVIEVTIDDSQLTEKYSISDCNGTASTFYYDDLNRILYVHTPDDDSPAAGSGGSPKYSVIAFFWIGIANKSKAFSIRKQLLVNNIFNFWVTSTDLENWVEWTAGSSTITKSTSVYDDKIEVYSVKLTCDGSGNTVYILGTFTTKPRRKHKIRIRYKAPVGYGQVRIRDSGSNVYLKTDGEWKTTPAQCINLNNISTWTEKTIEFVTHADYSSYEILIWAYVANAEVYISKVEIDRYYQPMFYRPLLSINSIPSINQSVGTYQFPETVVDMGAISIINDGWFWDKKDICLWQNKRIVLRCGDESWDYEEYPIFFWGVMRKPRYSTREISISGHDDLLILKTIPENKFDSTTYPNIDPDWAGRSIPIFVADVISMLITPVCIDTINHKYKITDVNLGGSSYDMYSLDYVYKNEKTLTITTDYTVDLTKGEFTLTKDPQDAEITCKGRGVETSVFGDGYAYRPADILYLYLVILNSISKHRLNWASFVDLYTNRNVPLGEYINEPVDTRELINRLQTTVIFQTFQRLDGIIEARRYRSDTPSDAPLYRNEDLVEGWEIINDPDQIYKELILRYKYNPTTKIYKEMYEASGLGFNKNKIEWEHGTKETLTLETNSITDFYTENLWINYMRMMEDPIELFQGTIKNPSALILNPTDKFKLSVIKTYKDEGEKTICDNDVFQVIQLTKNLSNGQTEVYAFKSSASLFWTIT